MIRTGKPFHVYNTHEITFVAVIEATFDYLLLVYGERSTLLSLFIPACCTVDVKDAPYTFDKDRKVRQEFVSTSLPVDPQRSVPVNTVQGRYITQSGFPDGCGSLSRSSFPADV